jgi:hypothetical protein
MRSREIHSKLRAAARLITERSLRWDVVEAMVVKYEFLLRAVTPRTYSSAGGVRVEECPCCAKYRDRYCRGCPAGDCIPFVRSLISVESFDKWGRFVEKRLAFWIKKKAQQARKLPGWRDTGGEAL